MSDINFLLVLILPNETEHQLKLCSRNLAYNTELCNISTNFNITQFPVSNRNMVFMKRTIM